MSDDLLPITEADVVPGAEFLQISQWPISEQLTGLRTRVLAVAEGAVLTLDSDDELDALSVADFITYHRKRAPKPPRHTVELRPPKKGERYLTLWGAYADGASVDYAAPRWVIVDDEADQ